VEDEALAREYLSALNDKSSDMCYKTNVAEWRFASDITDENERLKVFLYFANESRLYVILFY
jgi:peptidyl-dipeptidase A/DNA-directed RNA polymerase III subunit RPC1